MGKSEQCTEFQVVIHVILIFTIGALIGTSLVSKTDDLEVELVNKSTENDSIFTNLINQFNERMKDFEVNYTLVKNHGLSSFEINCLSLTNYFIDNSDGKELKIEFNDTFSESPKIFLSINGFTYTPSLIGAKGQKDELDFVVTDVNTNGFKIALGGSSANFNKNDFDGLDICYFAFIKFKPDSFKQHVNNA